MIRIPRHIFEDMVAHAGEDAPVEACGLLAGIGEDVRKCYRLTNVDAAAEHFSLDPKEQFAAVKDARAQGWEILAVYHSHPATPARMSKEDLRLAVTPGMRYAILSLAEPESPTLKCFRVHDGLPVEEEIEL